MYSFGIFIRIEFPREISEMPRRKLAILVSAYAAGIPAGYYYLERGERLEALFFVLSVIIAILFLLKTNSAGKGPKPGEEQKIHEIKVFRAFALLAFTLGIVIFGMSHYAFEADCSAALKSPDAELAGRVRSVSVKDDFMKLTLVSDRPYMVYIPKYSSKTALIEGGFTEGGENLLAGRYLRIRGELKMPKAADNPGCFDNRLHLRSKGIALVCSADSIEIINKDMDPLLRFRMHLYRTRESFLSYFEAETAGFLRGVIFGDKSEIDEEVIKEFNANATGHILAVSGLHVGFLYSLLRLLSGRKSTLPVSALIIAVIIIYGEMTLWSPATVRACIVLGVRIMALHLRRRFDLLSSVSAAALLILAYRPYQLFNAGFQMTFLALLGIAFAARPLSSYLGSALGFMLAVQIGIVPITAYTFYRVNPLSLFINIPIVLLSGFLVPLCIASLILMFIFGSLPQAFVSLADLTAGSLEGINHLLTLDGGFSLNTAGIGAFSVALTYICIFGLCSEWLRIRLIRKQAGQAIRAAAIILIPLLMFAFCSFDRFSDDEIVFVSVGQGDCVHIRTKKSNAIIDGGGREDFNTGERVLLPYLMHEGASKLDIAIATHLHMDHYKGICEISELMPAGAIGIPVDYKESPDRFIFFDNKEADSASEEMVYIAPKDVIHLGDSVYIEVLWPIEAAGVSAAIEDKNEHNAVYMIHYGRGDDEIKIMVTGDLLEEDELKMVEHYKSHKSNPLKCDILKIAHHGSKSSSSEAFLDAASPGLAVIQVGAGNLYGHPHNQTIERLSERGIRIFRTDINGAIGIDIGPGRKLGVDVFRED